MAYKIMVFVASVHENNVLEDGRHAAILELRERNLSVPPTVVIDADNLADLEASKGKLCSSLDKMAAMVKTHKERQASRDKKIIESQKRQDAGGSIRPHDH
jgi:hypothetical protein